ncbi:MAG: hypothetical protein Q7U13_04340 [Rhodoferax sp.]|nr:hypothetical protein [Rhodoferax sp.]
MWSPRSRSLHVGLTAQGLIHAKTAGLWWSQVVACERIDSMAVADEEPWRPAVTALARLLAAQRPGKTKLHIVLSGRFVRWQLLPWRPELTQARELSAYASLRFRETFGKAAQDWQVLHAPQAPGKAVPACAVDTALMEALRSTCETGGASLAAVTPYFASAFDRWRGNLNGKTAWFGLIEPDCLSLGLLHDGNWMGLHTQRLDGDWRHVLPGMMAQIGISAGLTETAPPLYLAGSGEAPLPDPVLAFAWLRPKAQASRAMADCRMALGV